MNVLEMESIGPVFGDILDMAHDMMFCLASVLELVDEGLDIHKRVNWMLVVFLHCVDPDIDVTIYLAHWILSQLHFLRFPSYPLHLTVLCACVGVVFD
jgi:hypothetical protein